MPEIEKQEFSFPDEEKKSVVEDDGGVDVEIETSSKETKSGAEQTTSTFLPSL